MWYRRVISDLGDLDTLADETAKCGFTSCTDSANNHIDFLDPYDVRLVTNKFANFGGGKRRTFFSTTESERARR